MKRLGKDVALMLLGWYLFTPLLALACWTQLPAAWCAYTRR